jgi:hypothetical protein
MTFDLAPPDEPYFRSGQWVRDNGPFLQQVIDIATRKSGGRGFAIRQNGEMIAGFVPHKD